MGRRLLVMIVTAKTRLAMMRMIGIVGGAAGRIVVVLAPFQTGRQVGAMATVSGMDDLPKRTEHGRRYHHCRDDLVKSHANSLEIENAPIENAS